MSTESYLPNTSDTIRLDRSSVRVHASMGDGLYSPSAGRKVHVISEAPQFHFVNPLSAWARSDAKRLFDCACVMVSLPVLLPGLLIVALAVRLTSAGPVLVVQKRAGGDGRHFNVFKFRTVIHTARSTQKSAASGARTLFTPVGQFLRRWNLDMLPQLFNVLAGHMSLVGPLPASATTAVSSVPCRAGIVAATTPAFALQESIMGRIPRQHRDAFCSSAVLPARLFLDAEYMQAATLLTDVKLLWQSLLRRWDDTVLEELVTAWEITQAESRLRESTAAAEATYVPAHLLVQMDRAQGEVRAW